MPATVKEVDFEAVDKAVVRFPTEEEHARGMDIVPRSIRVKEYNSGK